MAVVSMQNVVKTFGTVTALDGVDLEIQPGEVYGFIGPNGAGKTTAIRVLLGILRTDAGQAKVFGLDAWHDAVEIHRRTAYVPGEVNLWPHLTGGEVIDLFLHLRGSGNRKRRDDMIRRFDLDVTKKCGTYSKGNRQKVALVAAFAADADLCILDEPTSGLDPLMEQVFQQCVGEAKAQGKTVLLSSHILSEVERMCDKVSIIRHGKIIESGTLAELGHLSRLNLFAVTREPTLELHTLAGVHEPRPRDGGWAFKVDREQLGEVLEHLSGYGITHLESTPPTLEELFMHHYGGGGDG